MDPKKQEAYNLDTSFFTYLSLLSISFFVPSLLTASLKFNGFYFYWTNHENIWSYQFNFVQTLQDHFPTDVWSKIDG